MYDCERPLAVPTTTYAVEFMVRIWERRTSYSPESTPEAMGTLRVAGLPVSGADHR